MQLRKERILAENQGRSQIHPKGSRLQPRSRERLPHLTTLFQLERASPGSCYSSPQVPGEEQLCSARGRFSQLQCYSPVPVCSAPLHSCKRWPHLNHIQETYGEGRKEEDDRLRHGGKGSSQLNRHRAHKGFLGVEFFQGGNWPNFNP